MNNVKRLLQEEIERRIKRNHNARLGLNLYFWRTYDQKEIDLIEEDGLQLAAFEVKAGRKAPTAPKAFAGGYPEATFQVISKDNFLDFVG